MPVGYNSPARNLFVLGGSGQQLVTNFFKAIDKSSTSDGVFAVDEIRYSSSDQKYVLAGSASDSQSDTFGWIDKRDYDGETGASTSDYDLRIGSTIPGGELLLRALELSPDGNSLYACGKANNIPWVAKYSNATGVTQWESSSSSSTVTYNDIAIDSNNNVYACGDTPTLSSDATSFIEKYESDGTPSWGKQAVLLGSDITLLKIAANSRGHAVAVGKYRDTIKEKGYIVKVDTTTGDILWDRSLESNVETPTGSITPHQAITCESVFIDEDDNIFVTGREYISSTYTRGFVIKYSPEGNMLWQRETTPDTNYKVDYYDIQADAGTGSVIVWGTIYDNFAGEERGILTKYYKNGDVAWRRILTSSRDNSDYFGAFRRVAFDSDPSFYYLLFTDQNVDGLAGTPDIYTFGKVSTSGNGLGDFEYNSDGTTTLDYVIFNYDDVLGTLVDGSVRNDASDFVTYPYNANKIMFDDLATPVTNKKRQMDTADGVVYAGSPSIRPVDLAEMNLVGDAYKGSGQWLDESGNNNYAVVEFTSTVSTTTVTTNDSGSVLFNGSNTYAGILDTSNDFEFGTNDFTIEVFINAASLDTSAQQDSYACILDYGYGNTSNDGGAFFALHQQNGNIAWGSNNTLYINVPGITGEWQHIAVCRSGETTTLYSNGTALANYTDTHNYTDALDRILDIGRQDTFTGRYFDGCMTNLRIVNGTALYTSNFTPPTRPLTDVTNTVLLTCQGNIIDDASSMDHNISTFNGVDDIIEPNAGWGAVEFDGFLDGAQQGGSDYISTPDTQILEFGSDDFTIEGWVFPTGAPQGTFACICAKGISMQVYWKPQTNSIAFNLDDNGNGSPYGVFEESNLTGTNSVMPNEWTHFAICRNGSSFKAFTNGVERYSNSIPGLPPVFNSTNPFTIGEVVLATTGNVPFCGFISNLRVVKGTAVYAGNFTVPTSPLTSITNTSILTCQGNTIVDNKSGTPNVLTVVGNTAPTYFNETTTTSTVTVGPDHTSGLYFDYTESEYSPVPNLSSAKVQELLNDNGITVEMWFRISPNTGGNGYLFNFKKASNTQNVALYISNTGKIRKEGPGGDQTFNNGQTSDNVWHHLVFKQRVTTNAGANSLATFDVWLDGVLETENELDDYDAVNSSGSFQIGEDFEGDIGEVRLYGRELSTLEIYQNYNATKSKYFNEAPYVAAKISTSAIVYDTQLGLNYDFASTGTYDGAQNLLSNSEIRYTADGGIWQDTGESTLEYGFDDPFGTKTATKVTYVSNIGEIRLPNYTLVGNGPWTFSVYAKPISGAIGSQTGGLFLRISDTIPEGNEPSINVLFEGWKRYKASITAANINGGSSDYLSISFGSQMEEVLLAGAQVESDADISQASGAARRFVRTYGTAIEPDKVKNLSGDLLGKTSNGTLVNGAFVDANNGHLDIDGSPGQALLFDYTWSTSFSIEMWIKTRETAQAIIATLKPAGQGQSLSDLGMSITRGGNLSNEIRFGFRGGVNFDAGFTFTNNDWEHYVITYNGLADFELASSYTAYKNGSSGTVADAGTTVLSGQHTDNAFTGHDMEIGEFRIYNKVLTATEVSQNFNATRARYGV